MALWLHPKPSSIFPFWSSQVQSLGAFQWFFEVMYAHLNNVQICTYWIKNLNFRFSNTHTTLVRRYTINSRSFRSRPVMDKIWERSALFVQNSTNSFIINTNTYLCHTSVSLYRFVWKIFIVQYQFIVFVIGIKSSVLYVDAKGR